MPIITKRWNSCAGTKYEHVIGKSMYERQTVPICLTWELDE